MASLGSSSSHSMQLLRRCSSACICGRDEDLKEPLPTGGRVAEYAEGRGAPRLPLLQGAGVSDEELPGPCKVRKGPDAEAVLDASV